MIMDLYRRRTKDVIEITEEELNYILENWNMFKYICRTENGNITAIYNTEIRKVD